MNKQPTNPAPNGPGVEPKWTRGAKDMVVTAYSTASKVWATLSRGLINEVYYPTIDKPQLRDLQFLVSDGETFFHDERRDMHTELEVFDEHALGVRITNTDSEGRYKIIKDIITDPHEPSLLLNVTFEVAEAWKDRLELYVLCAPHLNVGGLHNSAQVASEAGKDIFLAHCQNTHLALGVSTAFSRLSCGFVGVNDGWQDLQDNFQMDYGFDAALDGNIALLGKVDLSQGERFTLALAFGATEHSAATVLVQSLSIPFELQVADFCEQWGRSVKHEEALESLTFDEGQLYHRSHALLLAHEDKTYPGAMVASLSIPWGQAKNDEQGEGGYHLVWTRDLVHSVSGLLAVGNTITPLRALIYIAVSQQEDGGFYQNFWVDGSPYWTGVQLDETAFPIILAYHLYKIDALQAFDPYPMVMKAAAYLIRRGPVTPQERWEENSGYSPSTLASNIAALTCAADYAKDRGDQETANFIQTYADFLSCHVEAWTVTSEGELLEGVARHFIRITPASPDDEIPRENPNEGAVDIANRPPGSQVHFPAKNIVDGGFLELVRFGIYPAEHPLIVDTLKVIDHVLKVDTPAGPVWRRYNHDGYGQGPDGEPYIDWGQGRAWPLLTGERAHYELAAGHDVDVYIKALEGFATKGRMLSEQVWDEADQPDKFLYLGEPTGAAMPLMWAHSEYLKLLKSKSLGRVFDMIEVVKARYADGSEGEPIEIWKPNRRIKTMQRGWPLRIQKPEKFSLEYSCDGSEGSLDSQETSLGIYFADLPQDLKGERLEFRFDNGERHEMKLVE